MTRSHIRVREAAEADLADLVLMWGALQRSGALSGRAAALAEAGELAEPVRRLLARPGVRILLASVADRPAGMAVLSTMPAASVADLSESVCLQVDHVIVLEEFRRRGVGRALVAAAAAYAEEVGAEQVAVSVAPMSREANRFFAQLGLAPLTLRRVAPALALRRRIAILERAAGPVGLAPRRALARSKVPAMRTALRRIAIASTVAEQPRDV